MNRSQPDKQFKLNVSLRVFPKLQLRNMSNDYDMELPKKDELEFASMIEDD